MILAAVAAMPPNARSAGGVSDASDRSSLVPLCCCGGPTDVLGRLVGEYLGRTEASGHRREQGGRARRHRRRSGGAFLSPTATRLFVTAASIFVLNPMLYKKLPYDPVKDFRMLALVTDLPVVMEVHPSVPAKTVA